MKKVMIISLAGLAAGLVLTLCTWRLSWYLLSCGGITFFCFGWDKHLAACGQERIPEHLLWFLSAAGGALAAVAAMSLFRHKTRKPGFYLPVYAFLIIQIAGLAWLLFS